MFWPLEYALQKTVFKQQYLILAYVDKQYKRFLLHPWHFFASLAFCMIKMPNYSKMWIYHAVFKEKNKLKKEKNFHIWTENTNLYLSSAKAATNPQGSKSSMLPMVEHLLPL